MDKDLHTRHREDLELRLAAIKERTRHVLSDIQFGTSFRDLHYSVMNNMAELKAFTEKLIHKIDRWPREMRVYLELGNVFILHTVPSIRNYFSRGVQFYTDELQRGQRLSVQIEIDMQGVENEMRLCLNTAADLKHQLKLLDHGHSITLYDDNWH